MVLSWAPGHEPAGSLGCGVAVDATLGELAFDGGDLEAVRARLLSGADPNDPSEFYDGAAAPLDRCSPLYCAAFDGGAAIVAALCEGGADREWRSTTGDTALQQAAYSGRVDVVKQLVRYAADVNARDRDGATALHHAAEIGNAAPVRALVACGADPTLRDNSGRRAAEVAELASGSTASTRPRAEIARYLRAVLLCRARQRLVFAQGALAAAAGPSAIARSANHGMPYDLLQVVCSQLDRQQVPPPPLLLSGERQLFYAAATATVRIARSVCRCRHGEPLGRPQAFNLALATISVCVAVWCGLLQR